MPTNLRRVTGRGDLHFITFCCYQRRPLLESPQARDFAVQILAEVRAKYAFALVGYVIMPEHVHFLIDETPTLLPVTVVQVFKQRVSRAMRGDQNQALGQPAARSANGDAELRRFWQRRYYDFNVYTREKLAEKLEYMHANPVVEKLVAHPRDWPWSSWSFYTTGQGLLKMDRI
jgi:putative transposase